MKHVRHLALAILPAALFAAGCGTHGLQPAVGMGSLKGTSQAAARAVAPDDPAILADDTRKANYWAEKYGGAANLVMSIQTTALNSQKISAAANVFYSPEAFYASQPCVFVSRHYLGKWLGQDTELADYNKLASKLKPIGNYTVKAAAAWSLAHGWQPVPSAPPCTTSGPCPSAPPAPAGKRFFSSSRAFLIQPDGGNAIWNLYAEKEKYVIDAVTGDVTPPQPQVDPNDQLNEGTEPDLQRACAVWLPMNPMQPNLQKDPS